jgi:hypothetical protein
VGRLVVVLVVLIHSVGTLARAARDRQLNFLLRSGIDALQKHNVSTFLDWSSLLSQWREGGFLYDEEDADLGVIVPPELDESHVFGILQSSFATLQWPNTVSLVQDPGEIFVAPEYNRLHLDLYLVRYHANQTVVPMWPRPTRLDSHAAHIHPRPFHGMGEVNGWPAPKNTESYLGSLYGYLGSHAQFNDSTGLYVPKSAAEYSACSGRWCFHPAHIQEVLAKCTYTLTRDIYFMVIMLPFSQGFRSTMEAQYQGWVDKLMSKVCSGEPPYALRDCF